MCVQNRVSLWRLLAVNLGAICGVAVTQYLLDGHVHWAVVVGMAAGWLSVVAVIGAIALRGRGDNKP